MPSIKDDLYNLIFRDLQHKSLTNLTDEEVQAFFDTWVNTGVSGTADVPVTLPQGVLYYDEEAKKLYIGQTDGSVQQLIALDDILKAENYNDNDMIIKTTISSIEVWSSITKADVRGFRRYYALVSQQYDPDLEVWEAPFPQVIENTIGPTLNPPFTMASPGVFNLRFSGSPMTDYYKVEVKPQIVVPGSGFGAYISGFVGCVQNNITANDIEIRTFNFSNVLSNGILSYSPLEIFYTP